MRKANQTKILKRAIAHYGEENQLFKIIEEHSELIKAVCKYKQNWSEKTIDELCSEIADTEIMLEQLRLILNPHGIEDTDISIENYKIKKLKRLNKRIKLAQAASVAASAPIISRLKK